MKAIFFILLTLLSLNVFGQENYPARVVGGALYAHDLFKFQAQDAAGKVSHLHTLDIDVGFTNWYWTANAFVAGATTNLNIEIEAKFRGFTMKMPDGSYRHITFEEAGMSKPEGYAINHLVLDVEFGKIDAWAEVMFQLNGGNYNQKKHWTSSVRWTSNGKAYDKYVVDNKLKNVTDIMKSLDPQITVREKGRISDHSFFLGQIEKYIGKVYADHEKQQQEEQLKKEGETLLAQARDAEASGDMESAEALYEQAQTKLNEPSIQEDIRRVKNIREEQKGQVEAGEAAEYEDADNYTGTISSNNSGAPQSQNSTAQSNTENTYSYDPQAWAKFNQSQQQVKQWSENFDRQITINQQNQKIKQQRYEQMGTEIGSAIGNFLNEMERRKEEQRINKRTREINGAVDGAYGQLYDDADYWLDFQKQLIDFGGRYKSVITPKALENINMAVAAIKSNLERIEDKVKQLDADVEYQWGFARDMNDVFKFPLTSFQNMNLGKTDPGIGYYLVTILNSGGGIPNTRDRSAYITDIASLLSEYAVDVQNFNYILSSAGVYKSGKGASSRYEALLSGAQAIEAYIALKHQIQLEYDAFEKDLKENKGFLKITNSNSLIHLVDVYPLTGAQKNQQPTGNTAHAMPYSQSMETLFPRITELNIAYSDLKDKIGEFRHLYSRYSPDKSADFKAGGYYVEPGTVKILLSQRFMEPDPLEVSLNVAKGSHISVDLASYSNRFRLSKLFRPFGVTLKDGKFHQTKSFIPASRNRGFPNNYKLNFAYTAYNFGISEFSTTLFGKKTYKGMRGYERNKWAFFSSFDFPRVFYGKGSIITGYEDISGEIYKRDITDLSYIGTDLAQGGVGITKGLFGGTSQLEIGAFATLLNFRSFSVEATHENSSGGSKSLTTGDYRYPVLNYAIGHGKVAFNTHIGQLFINLEYSLNYYPAKGASDIELGENGDISQLDDDYKERFTSFFEDVHADYFNNSFTIYILF
ncbi:hypothetical protein LVD17_04950 [Fulvivirga ulvae]|uniref:hypothetical protein n=1 Tax=Fulvivirga ulvae TaxID=2904245 RepID=UPI001F21EADA|nr:hypothetical protein [Fulvivirga ulvae]UII33174.1 hypothetical protein LVD17_04950 [Fulvivirga ulvae]